MLVPGEEMPWTVNSGIVPDLIFNPHGFPTRMTIGMMVEFLAGKSAALTGALHLCVECVSLHGCSSAMRLRAFFVVLCWVSPDNVTTVELEMCVYAAVCSELFAADILKYEWVVCVFTVICFPRYLSIINPPTGIYLVVHPSVTGKRVDATPFQWSEDRPPYTEYCQQLADCGFNYWGTEMMMSGCNGRQLEAHIYVGVVYYQRLRHMVADKYQVIATAHHPT